MMKIDFHCDTLEKMLDDKLNFNSKKLMISAKKINQYLPYVQCFASFVDPKYKSTIGGFERAKQMIELFYEHQDHFSLITCPEDLENSQLNQKPGAILTIENGSAISSNLDNIDWFYEKGVRIMSVVWNEDNELSSGNLTKQDNGLTSLGKEYIRKLEEKKIAVDVSHMPKKSFVDTIKIATRPIIDTHTGVNHFCSHPRTVTDRQIREIANTKGLIGICLYKIFLTEKETCTSQDIANHIDYIANLVGIDYVGIGTDFDGIPNSFLPEDISGPDQIFHVFENLEKMGYTKQDLAKISHQNFIRYWKEVTK